MSSPPTRRRGPRHLPRNVASDSEVRGRILMPELLGRVVMLARQGVGASQQEIAGYLALPQSVVSRLERGEVVMSVFHLDLFADAFSHFGEKLDDGPVTWEGWELHRAATLVGDALEDADYAVEWVAPHRVPDSKARLYIQGRGLKRLVRQVWPDPFADRL